jgi:hypothetical protein
VDDIYSDGIQKLIILLYDSVWEILWTFEYLCRSLMGGDFLATKKNNAAQDITECTILA